MRGLLIAIWLIVLLPVVLIISIPVWILAGFVCLADAGMERLKI